MNKHLALEIAKSTGWLSHQSPTFQEQLLSRCVLRNYDASAVLCHAGDVYNGIYALLKGTLKIEFAVPGEDYRMISVKQPVFWFGQGASLREGTFAATMTATNAVTALFLPHHEFEILIDNVTFCRAFAVLTVEHFDEASQIIGQLLVGDAENRVAARLALLAAQTGPAGPACISINQFELAEMCGLSRGTTQQILSRLEQKNLIKTGYRKIEIHDPEALTGGVGKSPVISRRESSTDGEQSN